MQAGSKHTLFGVALGIWFRAKKLPRRQPDMPASYWQMICNLLLDRPADDSGHFFA